MSHKDIYVFFEKLLPMFASGVTEWFPNGKGSIRVRLGQIHQDYIFTFNNVTDWKFETLDSFMKTFNKK